MIYVEYLVQMMMIIRVAFSFMLIIVVSINFIA